MHVHVLNFLDVISNQEGLKKVTGNSKMWRIEYRF